MALIDRVKNMLLTPKTEWPVIAGETTTVQSLYVGYILILAAIGPIAMALRLGLFGMGIGVAVISYIVALIMVYLLAWIVDALAPTFGGEKNFIRSLQLTAYSFTAAWVAGIFHLIPFVGGLLALAAVLLAARAIGALRARRALVLVGVTLLVTVGTATMRADTIERFAEFIGIRERVADTGVESYAHRTLLAYIGGRIWLDRPVTGVGWQASSEEWAYGPFLDDARARFPGEPDQAFPSPEHPWGIQMLYLQVAADLGLAGIALLLGLAAAGVAAAVRGLRSSPVPLVGLGWLCVVAGVWTGIGLVAGLPLEALTWIAFGLVTVRE